MTRRIPEGTLIIVADGGSARVFTNVGSAIGTFVAIPMMMKYL